MKLGDVDYSQYNAGGNAFTDLFTRPITEASDPRLLFQQYVESAPVSAPAVVFGGGTVEIDYDTEDFVIQPPPPPAPVAAPMPLFPNALPSRAGPLNIPQTYKPVLQGTGSGLGIGAIAALIATFFL
jgi:hypothetical protein